MTPEEIDKFISAQLPNQSVDPIGFKAVSSFMIHDPCGAENPSCSCMVDGECSKYYPKDFCDRTTMLQNGHVRYARPNNGRTTHKNGIDVDNRSVVPHNVDLLVKYQAHINVERVNRDGMEKYLFKYFCKGFDCAKVGLQHRKATAESSTQVVNEIRDYLECRCVTPNDAAWRLLQFDIHHTDPAVERLPCHLPFENSVVFTEDDNLQQVLQNPCNEITKLTSWLKQTRTFHHAAQFTYAEFPEHFTWHGDGKFWDSRRGSRKIGRVAHVGPNQGESYYLRMLLHIVKGAKSFSDVRTVEGHRYPTFQDACQALGLLGDDREWSFAMSDAAHWAFPYQLRELFVTLLFCNVANPLVLLEEHAAAMGEDFAYHTRSVAADYTSCCIESYARSYVLTEIDMLLKNSGYNLEHFNLPQSSIGSASIIGNRLLIEEQAYDMDRISTEAAEQLGQLNPNQKCVYDGIINSINNCIGQIFFVYSYGGTGKTFLWNTLLNSLRAQGKIALLDV